MEDNLIETYKPESNKTEEKDKVYFPIEVEDKPIFTNIVATEVINERINTTGVKGSVIDSKGLVSVNNFTIDSVESYGNSRMTTSTAFVDLTSTTLTFSTDRDTRVLFLCSASAGASDWANEGIIRVFIGLNINGVLYPNSTYGFNSVLYWHDTSDAGFTRCRPFWSASTLVTVIKGDHTAKLQFCRHLLDNLTAEVVDTSLTYIILGK